MAQEWALSIDFGTSNTAAAHTSPSGNGVQTLPLSHQSNLMTSAVFVESPNSIYAGDAALHRADDHPHAFLSTPKRMLGFGVVPVNGYEILPAELIAAPLRAVYERALSLHDNVRPARVVLTHPEAWSIQQVAILTEAAALAGIDPSVVGTISEPRAAVHYYTRTTPLPTGARIAVFDFGAGTLDVAVLDVTDRASYEVIAARGDNSLGGKNFDGLVRRWIDQQLDDRDPQLRKWLQRSASPQDVHALEDQIRRAKELLSEHPTATIRVAGDGVSLTLTLTREEFDQIISEQVQRALILTRKALTDSGTNVSSLVALYLTGGSSRIPLVHRRLSELGTVATLDDPKTVVAQGALHAPLEAITGPASTASRHDEAQHVPTVAGLRTQVPTDPSPAAHGRKWLPIAASGVLAVGLLAIGAALLRPDAISGEATSAQYTAVPATVTAGSTAGTSTSPATAAPIAPRATAVPGEPTPRGNIVGTLGEPMTSGCTSEGCDLEVTLTAIESNPDRCHTMGGSEDDETIVVHSTVVTGPNPITINGALTSSITWSAVDGNGSIDSNLNGSRSGNCGDYESSTLMPNSKYTFATVLGVPGTYDTLIWAPISHPDLISAPGLEFSIRTEE
ncbi:Hsp70 family protein [Rhodococcus artemisiae]|uniref:Hsp70 family protein n=1 Tax=Rhodococcus artemisiae TaxID=714159 RepID=A0ABU7LKR7_9NOCA|nr:Hsp70 family protein [Rhodococcus artemisiae]MEE2061512.1 Hsp70 family protein [Rhodococcus artemisiae]